MARFVCSFISSSLMRTVDVTVIIPSVTMGEAMALGTPPPGMPALPKPPYPSYCEKPLFPVVYLLHGMGNHHQAWTAYAGAERYAEERNIALVMPSAENSSYINHDASHRFFDFIADELPDFICGMFPVSKRPEDSYIAGLSMGGFGAMVHFLNRPKRYAAAGSFSGALAINPFELSGNPAQKPAPEQQPMALVEQIRRDGKTLPPVYVSCGEEDFLLEDNRKFAESVKAVSPGMLWATTPGMGHEWRFWNTEIEKFLDWIPRTDIYAGLGRRPV